MFRGLHTRRCSAADSVHDRFPKSVFLHRFYHNSRDFRPVHFWEQTEESLGSDPQVSRLAQGSSIDLEGRLVKDGVRKSLKDRQNALTELVHAIGITGS